MDLWPLMGGTPRERLKAVALFLLLIGGWAGIYVLAWVLSPYF